MPSHPQDSKPITRLLLGAGPSNVNPRVLKAMSTPILGHLDPEFLKIMDDVRSMLRTVFQTHNDITLPISGTGSAGMEAALVNILEPGDAVLIGNNGYFSTRLIQIAQRCGSIVHSIDTQWGDPIDPQDILEALRKHRNIKAVAMVHGETSTGILNPISDISRLAHEYGAMMIVDTVTTIGAVHIAVDDWKLDVCYGGTQKGLGCSPGLAPITIGSDAETAIHSRKTPVQSWYFDMSELMKYWGKNRAYHHTAPISMIYGLKEGLNVVLEEGLTSRIERHSKNANALRIGLESLGLKLFAKEDARLATLTSVRIPKGVNDLKVRSKLLNDFNIEIGGGLGPVAGAIWRIGLMGENSTAANIITLLNAFEEILSEEWHKITPGEAVTAAEQELKNK